MVRFIRNPSGAIHSVADDFDLAIRKAVDEAWEEVSEDIAKAEHAHLFGEPDPAVEAVRAHDGAGNPIGFDILGNPEIVTSPTIAEVPSTEPQGKPDPRKIEPTPTPADIANAADTTEATK